MSDTVRRSVDDTSRELLLAEPYFGHLFVGMVRSITDGEFVTRLSFSGHVPRIEVNAPAWQSLGTPKKRQAALKHELLHLTFKHPLRAREFALLDLWGLACDLVVNQLLDAREIEGAFTLDQFAELGLARDQTADYYYAALLPLYERCKKARLCQDTGDGACDDPQAMEAMDRWCSGDSSAARSHETWESFRALSSAALSVLETNVDALIEATVRRARCRRWGPLPGRLIEYLTELVDKKAEVPWRRILRLFGATSERTYLKNTISRPSKRYGTTPGIRVKRRTNIVVAVDTSGSVPNQDLAIFFSEIYAMWRRGAAITILEADALVQREYPYRGRTPEVVMGRAGTNFTPAIERANTLHPDALIYFTDGGAPHPAVKPRMPVLWVISADGFALDEAGHLPGRRVKLTREV